MIRKKFDLVVVVAVVAVVATRQKKLVLAFVTHLW